MPEIKHVFSQGKMNKDLDERLIPNGQYTDANNIQVSTSDADDVGTVQSLLGNSAIPVSGATTISSSGFCVGSIADESNNTAYWLVAHNTDWVAAAPASILTYKDAIYKSVYNATANTHTVTPVFIDFWLEKHPTPSAWVSGSFSGTSFDFGANSTDNLSVGMYIKFEKGASSTYRKITDITGTTITWDSTYTFAGGFGPSWVEFSWQVPNVYNTFAIADSPQFKKRVLRFDKNKLITGLNIIDDLLFWTDNNTEPKKINLTRALAGTDASNLNKSTKLIVNSVDAGYYKESDITVIKQNPTTAPILHLNTLVRSGTISTTTSFNFDGKVVGDIIEITTGSATSYKSNDNVLFGNNITPSTNEFHVRTRVRSVDDTTVSLSILSLQGTPSGIKTYNLILEDVSKNLFEEKFVRFAVRWKYADGEYSTISPFSELAFAPAEEFKYETIEGYNKAMVNQVKEVVIKDFIPVDISEEVVQIDILYKESNSPIIYTVDNIRKTDIVINGANNAWNTTNESLSFQGKYTITSENIYAAIPSNQILRHFDNVPRRALAQSVSGNRLIYGNYLQNYNVEDFSGDTVKIQVDALVSPRLNESAQMLANHLVTPFNSSTGNSVDGWSFDASWQLISYYTYWFLGGGFEPTGSSGVTQFHKIYQNLTFKNNSTYKVKFKVDNYQQGTLRIQLIAPNYYAQRDVSANGDYELTFTLDTANTNAINTFFNSGKTFVLQSLSSTNNWKGQVSDFSCKEVFESTKKSIKSQRNYQIGVVYADEFGRQTPVLTDETASLKVPKLDSLSQNSIKVKLNNQPPVNWAHSFKFFIKETSSEYYNLAMDRIYKSLDDNVWISFPSSERNKVDEETYLVLKKQIDSDFPVLDESATYKVLAIENEAPEFIRLDRNSLGIATGLNTTGGINTLFGDTNYRPTDDQKVIAIKKDVWLNNDDGAPLDDINDLVVRFKDGVTLSDYYSVDLLSVKEINGTDYYFFHLNQPISDYDASWIMTGTNLNSSVSFTVFEEKDKLKPEFKGKFFVKLLLDDNLRDFVLSQALLAEDNVGIVARTEAWYASDDGAVGVGNGTATRYQKDTTNVLVQTTVTNDAPFDSSDDYDNSGDSSYSPSRGTMYYGHPSLNLGELTFRLSEEALTKWVRILKFKLYGSWSLDENTTPLNDTSATRKNFFIDRVSYIGVQPLDKNLPADGEFRAPGYWSHKLNKAFPGTARYGRGVFKADGTEKKFNNWQIDNWFTPGKYYMELSYAKIWADSKTQNVLGTQIDNTSSWSDAWAVGQTTNSNHVNEQEFVKKLKVGSKFRFSGDVSEKTYKITKIRQERRWNHTAYPEYVDSNGNSFIVAQSENGDFLRMSEMHGGQDQEVTFDPSEIFNPNTRVIATQSVSSGSWNSRVALNDEKDRFGLATNRRLTWTIEIEEAPGFDGNYDPLNRTSSTSSTLMDEDTPQFIEFVEPSLDDKNQLTSSNPAIFETQPKTDEGLDIYYEASDFISVGNHTVFHELPWFNCYSFGNGVESNRIKDDFNQVVIDKNPRASTTLQGEYEEERRKYGLIYSGIYNSTSGVNETNQFITAEKITKDINPEYGSIQKIHARNSDLLTLCEDKVLRIQANKDALFNADGNINVTASSNVLGQTIPFAGDYGISKNPESFVTQNYRAYFTDKQRGAVLRLSMDGLTPISDAGMGDWFKDNLKPSTTILGTYDNSKKEYNVTLKGSSNYTVSYKENVKGWTSFKSYIPEQGVSVANNYYTIAPDSGNLKIWWHHKNTTRNNFYGTQYDSDVTFVFNEQPSVIKTFKTLNYEGTQARVEANTNTTEGEYYNLTAQTGWYAEDVSTDKQSGQVNEFVEKEGKWFNFIKGDTTSLSNLDTAEFNVQGLGVISSHTTAN